MIKTNQISGIGPKKFLVIKEKILCNMCHKKPPPPTAAQKEKELPQIQCPRHRLQKLMTFSLSLPVSQSTPTQFPKANASSSSNWRIGFKNKLQS
jgi:hypothetical protein